MRLFVAIDIDEVIRERLTQFVRRLKQQAPDVRFVGPETYHVTLKFIGDTTKVDAIREVLQRVKVPQFEMSVRGTGFFPNERQPRVFWAGIEAGPQLRELADWTASELAPLGFGVEGAFKPHLSLARSGSGSPRPKAGDRANPKFQRIRELMASEPARDFGTMTAREFFLFESKLTSHGAVYSKVERYELTPR